MGEWLAPVAGGLIAGVAVAVLAIMFRGTAPKWTVGGRLAVLIVAAVLIGAATPVLLRPSQDARPVGADDDTLTRLAAQLRSADLDARLAAIRELDQLGQYQPVKVPEIIELTAEFVRDRAPKADDPRCASGEPAEDVYAALKLLRARATTYDANAIIDLHGTCLANADIRAISLLGAKLAGANLTGSSLKSADLTRADLHDANLAGTSLAGANLVDTKLIGARFADTDVRGAQFSDDTFWPPQHENAVMAASSFATTTFVIGELVLSDPR